MENKHIPVMIEEIKSYIPVNKELNIIDATFGGGGYSKIFLENFKIGKLIAIDRDPLSNFFAKKLSEKYNNFKLINGCFGEIDNLIENDNLNNKTQFDLIIFDLGLSTNQLEDPKRGFSFLTNSPLNMGMGNNKKTVLDVINNYSENELADILYKFGEEKFSRKIAKKIINARKIKDIENTKELSLLIKKSYKNKSKIDPATRTFQALRIYVNDELNELSKALEKSLNLLKVKGKIIIVSFHSLEDRLVKDFFNHNSGKRWRSSRHYPELADDGPITLKLITKKLIRPSDLEININPRSRSARLRVAEKISIN
ncbi:16S rRNA (cytosine(1402)-N(4))-methyltransferase RsmH [Alphaproteobacteria bacterium]|nr:16S rRNA (cytosine(1402)-N(4))-methyltransferase RsmH [Alphaproteobacteria bacterium]